MNKANPRIVIAGSVNSSRVTLEKLVEHKMNVTGVLALSPNASNNVSGYVDLSEIAKKNGLEYKYFKAINDQDTIDFVKKCRPDYMFVVGLSQLVKKPLLNIPSTGAIGFHPTKLPKGRGRAAVAWMILGEAPGAATYFMMGEGMDDGPILAQEEFEISNDDYASDIIDKIINKAGACLDRLLPKMKNGSLNGREQKHEYATYLGKRNPEDGLISWNHSAVEIHRLIRAVSDPLPGAYTYFNGTKIIIRKANITSVDKCVGVIGGVLKNDKEGILVQTGNGLLRLTDVIGIEPGTIRVGRKFGINYEKRLNTLQQEINNLKNKIK